MESIKITPFLWTLREGGIRAYKKSQNRRKNHPKPKNRKKIRSKSKTACKTVKNDTFSYPSYQHPDRSDAVVTSGTSYRVN